MLVLMRLSEFWLWWLIEQVEYFTISRFSSLHLKTNYKYIRYLILSFNPSQVKFCSWAYYCNARVLWEIILLSLSYYIVETPTHWPQYLDRNPQSWYYNIHNSNILYNGSWYLMYSIIRCRCQNKAGETYTCD